MIFTLGQLITRTQNAQCIATDNSERNAKACKSLSERLTGADRTAVLDAIKALNTAATNGKPEEAAAAMRNNGEGLDILELVQLPAA